MNNYTENFKESFTRFVEITLESSKLPQNFISVLGIVQSLIIENRIDELEAVIRLHFPEYYHDYKPFIVHPNEKN